MLTIIIIIMHMKNNSKVSSRTSLCVGVLVWIVTIANRCEYIQTHSHTYMHKEIYKYLLKCSCVWVSVCCTCRIWLAAVFVAAKYLQVYIYI